MCSQFSSDSWEAASSHFIPSRIVSLLGLPYFIQPLVCILSSFLASLIPGALFSALPVVLKLLCTLESPEYLKPILVLGSHPRVLI